MVNQKVLPFPSSDSTPISPFRRFTIVRQIDNPSPVPLYEIVEFGKTFEHVRKVFFGNTFAGVGNIKTQAAFYFFISHSYSSSESEFAGIGQKICYDLCQACLFRVDKTGIYGC